MNIESLEIPDIKLISLSVFGDDRGYFMETFNQRLFNEKIKITN
ncbi:MAG: dTDP-4-dehydrorhamnose 3,5-epimerase family protein, partial [bacterium]